MSGIPETERNFVQIKLLSYFSHHHFHDTVSAMNKKKYNSSRLFCSIHIFGEVLSILDVNINQSAGVIKLSTVTISTK